MLNSVELNRIALNAPKLPFPVFQGIGNEVYLLEIGVFEIPMSSFQATIRSEGQSFLQVIVPAADQYVSKIAPGSLMRVRFGYYYPDIDEFGALSVIAEAPLEIIRFDEGPSRATLSLSGYNQIPPSPREEIVLEGVRSRSINQGLKRVRADVNLDLRPGHDAIDVDGEPFRVDQIQYFVNATSSAMEVLERLVLSAVDFDFSGNEWIDFVDLRSDWSFDQLSQLIKSDWNVGYKEASDAALSVPFAAVVTIEYKVKSNWLQTSTPPTEEEKPQIDNFSVFINGERVFVDAGLKDDQWYVATFTTIGPVSALLSYTRESSGERDDSQVAQINRITMEPVDG
jgi:hypothetical protein